MDTAPVKKILFEKVGDYHEHVLDDEVHAWLMNNGPELAAHGLDLRPYEEVIVKLQAIYKGYDEP